MDIDIDTQSRFDPLTIFPKAVRASRVERQGLVKHPCGVYFQNMPVDKVTGFAAIPFQQAEERGFTKIDFLHLSLLDQVSSKQELRDLASSPPDWSLLQDRQVVEGLFHISKHYDLVSRLSPRSIQELADCIALIRPGKNYLLDSYMADKNTVRAELYEKTAAGYYFKRSHAISYALNIVIQLNIISTRGTKKHASAEHFDTHE